MLTRANDTNYVVNRSNNPLLYNEVYRQRNIIVSATFIELCDVQHNSMSVSRVLAKWRPV